MAVAVGDRVPEVELMTMTKDGVQKVASADALGTGKIVLFAVPGAFTPTCSDHHLPGYVVRADEFKDKGVDTVACLSVNDAFVMGAWGGDQEGGDNADFTKAVGLEMDGSGFGLGRRSQRYAAVIEGGVVPALFVEPGPGLTV